MATPFGIFINKRYKNSQALLNHELIHYRHMKNKGLFFFVDYIKENMKMGYDKNKYEIEARIDESDFCKLNYTHCVRSGLAKTAYNKNFRK